MTKETVYGLSPIDFTKDGHGNVATVVRAGHTTSYEYSFGLVKQITLPNGNLILREIDDNSSDGRPVVTKETRKGSGGQNERATTFMYDHLFRLTSTQPPGGVVAITTSYNKGPLGSDKEVSATVTRGPSVVTTDLDGFGRARCTVDSVPVQACTTYDAEGRKASESLPRILSGPLVWTTFSYDGLGRLNVLTHPDTHTVQYVYAPASDGQKVSITDESARVTEQTLKAFGNPSDAWLAKVVDADNKTWTYAYNVLGSRTSVTSPTGSIRTWTYDASNRLTSETQTESQSTAYAYFTGTTLLQTKTDANGTMLTYAYDANDRLTTVTAAGHATSIEYEAGGDNRKQTTVTAGTTTTVTTFTYDGPTGRLIGRTDVINGGTPTSSTFAYNTLDQVITLTYPGGRQVGYEYDDAGRITRVFSGSTNYALVSAYHPSGAVSQYTGPAATSLVHQFEFEDQTYRLHRMTAGTGANVVKLTYGYDAVGNVLAITDDGVVNNVARGWTQTFGYDVLDRITSASQTGPYSGGCYAYDGRGNRLNAPLPCTTTYIHDTHDRLTSLTNGAGTTTFTFAAIGNGSLLTQTPPGASTATYTYTPEGLLANVVVNGNETARYQYDADGWRILTTVGSTTTYTLRGPSGQLLRDQTSSVTRDYIYLGSLLVAVVRNDGSDTVYDITTDAIGSIRMITNATTGAPERHDFGEFGEEVTSSSAIVPLGWAGKEVDVQTGFSYFGARYYLPKIGRFTIPDDSIFAIAATPQKWNLYAGVLNNPLRFVDPDGHNEDCVNGYNPKTDAFCVNVMAFDPDPNNSIALSTALWGNPMIIGTGYQPRPPSDPPFAWYQNFTRRLDEQLRDLFPAVDGAEMKYGVVFEPLDLRQIGLALRQAKAVAGVMKQIANGTTKGKEFYNMFGQLPVQVVNYYREYTVPLAGQLGRGEARLIVGEGGEVYFTPKIHVPNGRPPFARLR